MSETNSPRLAGVRVVDISEGVAGGYCTRLLAGLAGSFCYTPSTTAADGEHESLST